VAQAEVVEQYSRTQWRFLPRKVYPQMTDLQRIFQGIIIVLAQIHRRLPYIPLLVYRRRQPFLRLNLQPYPTGLLDGVGTKRYIVAPIIVITVITEKGGKTVTLSLQLHHTEGVAHLQQSILRSETYQCVGHIRKTTVSDGVEYKQMACIHTIGDFFFPGILLRNDATRHLSTKKTKIVQQIGGHLAAHLGIDG